MGVGHCSNAIFEEAASHFELYSRPFGALQAIVYQRVTFFATSARPSSGENSSPFVSSRRRMFVMKPTETNVTLLSGAEASALR